MNEELEYHNLTIVAPMPLLLFIVVKVFNSLCDSCKLMDVPCILKETCIKIVGTVSKKEIISPLAYYFSFCTWNTYVELTKGSNYFSSSK
jgi:hypothetical protein